MSWRRGLYVITDGGPELPGRIESAITGGAVLVQYRDKGDDTARRRQEAEEILEVCRGRGVPLLINDDVALAEATGADGVHLGRDDAAIAEARQRLGPDAMIGASCYDELETAGKAVAAGASYVAFGSFFPSTTKANPARPGLELLRQAKAQLHVPIAAIGGITPDNGAALVAAGADLLAVVSGVFRADDVTTAARRYAALF